MADRWSAELEVFGWPADAVTSRRRGFGASTYEADEIDFDGLLALAEREDRPALAGVHEIMRELGWEFVPSSAMGGVIVEYEDPTDATGYPSRLYVLDELASGSWGLQEQGLLEALREAGLAYFASDEGKYEHPGTFFAWAPGWEAERQGTYAAEEGPVLTQSKWTEILGRVNTLAEAARAVGDHFHVRTAVIEAAGTAAEEE